MISFGQEVCQDYARATSKEWLETNGLGGFASSTINGANTRRYHSLLTIAMDSPGERLVLFSKMEETVISGPQSYELSCNQFPGVIHPEGFRYLQSFRSDPYPIFTYQSDHWLLEKSVFMVYGRNTTVLVYTLKSNTADIELILRPLIACRDYHHLHHENPEFHRQVLSTPTSLRLNPYPGCPPLILSHNATWFEDSSYWYRHFQYLEEQKRALDFEEDLYSPGCLGKVLREGESFVVIASPDQEDIAHVTVWKRSEITRREKLGLFPSAHNPFMKALGIASDIFLVKRSQRNDYTVMAGYHWFGEWGRDTFLSLPGLALVTGRIEIAESLLKSFADYCSKGMIPNRIPEAHQPSPDYNSVDASLWYFWAVENYLQFTGDLSFVLDHLYDTLVQIFEYYVKGTRYQIHETEDGLLYAGEAGVQLTWMDAKVDDWVVTPRIGKPVEINALWFNAIHLMKELAEKKGQSELAARCLAATERVKESFERTFWNSQERCLFDCVTDTWSDASVRPNQILAVSLTHPLLSVTHQRQVVDKVERELLTPYGLRTLSPCDPRYAGRYEGTVRSRDGAYHQGTVWPWLLGPFITAYLKVHDNSQEAKGTALKWLQPLEHHLQEAGLGNISEIFDGDPPHRPVGCIAQAWSVAEVLRAAHLLR